MVDGDPVDQHDQDLADVSPVSQSREGVRTQPQEKIVEHLLGEILGRDRPLLIA
jgi:hypothetical protein